jgi:hypothetical protein
VVPGSVISVTVTAVVSVAEKMVVVSVTEETVVVSVAEETVVVSDGSAVVSVLTGFVSAVTGISETGAGEDSV